MNFLMMKGKACPEKRLTVRQMANINFLLSFT